MYAVRLWSVRHARGLSRFYASFEAVLVRLAPLFERIGYPGRDQELNADRKTS